MKLFILKADNSQEINEISEELSKSKFKTIEQENNYTLMKRRRYGNYAVHMFCLFIGLFLFWPLLLVNVVYFTYSYLFASPHVLITTEYKANNGEMLKFNSIDEVLSSANAMF